MFCSGDLLVPLRYCSYCSAQVLVGLVELVAGAAFGVRKVQALLHESKNFVPLLFLTLFVKKRVGSVVVREDWAR